MKNYLLLLTLFAAAACNNNTDKKSEPGSSGNSVVDTTKVINDALHYADEVSNNLSSFVRDSIDLEGMSTEGGVLLIYKPMDSLVKLLSAENYGEMGRNEENIWLSDGRPALQYLKEINYDRHMYEPGMNIRDSVITYMVYHKGNPFVMLDSAKRLMAADSATFNERAERIKAVLPGYLSQAGIKQ